MSGTVKGIPENWINVQGVYAPGSKATQGMIAGGEPLVDSAGQATPANMRFMWALIQAVNSLQAQVNTINQRLTNAGIP